MRLLWVIGVLALAALCPAARAFSPVIEILPDGPDHGSKAYAIDVTAERLADGDTQFTVTVTPRVRQPIRASLGFATNDSVASGLGHITMKSRRLDTERIGNSFSVKCVFSVTPKELANPDLSFIFNPPGSGEMVFTTYYLQLRKFVKP